MKIIKAQPDESVDRMFCPSTNEVIFAPGSEEINANAEAIIGYWHNEILEEPSIADSDLASAWDEYFEKWEELTDEIDGSEAVKKFLKKYKNPKWKVFECIFNGIACGPVSFTVFFVVKADTVIEEDPDNNE